jgi:hypothetical protein
MALGVVTQSAAALIPPGSEASFPPPGIVVRAPGPQRATRLVSQSSGTSLPVAPLATVKNPDDVQKLRRRLREDIRALTGASIEKTIRKPAERVINTVRRDGYELRTIALRREDKTELLAAVALPVQSGSRPATILMDIRPLAATIAPGGDLDLLAKDGAIVMAIEPPPSDSMGKAEPDRSTSSDVLTRDSITTAKTAIGQRIDDARLAVAWLRSQRVTAGDLTLHGIGPHSVVALHTAVLDEGISTVVLEDMLTSYRLMVGQPVHPSMQDVVIPGVLRRYDVGDLLLATFPAFVAIVTPLDASGRRMTAAAFTAAMAQVARSEESVKSGQVKMQRITALFSVR